IKLRGIVDRPEKPGQIVKEGVVPSADIGFDSVPAGRLQSYALVGFDDRGKTPSREIEKANTGSVAVIDGYPNLGRLQHAQILVLDPFQVRQQTFKAPIVVASP